MTSQLFADTAFWIALSSRRDEHHLRAVTWSNHVSAARMELVTTEAVLWEWLNAMAQPETRNVVVQGYKRCHRDTMTQVVDSSSELTERAVELYERRSDKAWSLTDCLSFVVMQDCGIREALTTDNHFEQAGFRILLWETPSERS